MAAMLGKFGILKIKPRCCRLSALGVVIQKASISGSACDFQLMTPFVNEACNPNLAWATGRMVLLQVKCHLPHFAEY